MERDAAEGDTNLTPRRAGWARRNLGPEAQEWLAEDAAVFLHQALSTPCLNVPARCEGIYLEDLQGRGKSWTAPSRSWTDA